MAKVLLGFMGSGKTTIARKLNPDFVDMDALLEDRLGMPIARFFEEKGEEVISEKHQKDFKKNFYAEGREKNDGSSSFTIDDFEDIK